MKKIFVYVMSSALLVGTTMSSCTYSGYESYLGTMAGAEIGGIIGESIGWMNTSRHSGPGNAMLGGIIGTVAGAAIGNAIGNEAAESKKAERKARKRSSQQRYEDYSDNGSYDFGNYQTEGGRSDLKGHGALEISNLHYEDEDGDGRISRYETINVIYEITNTSGFPVEVSLLTGNNDSHFEYSPASNATIGAGKTIRYKAKVFCKSVPKASHSEIPIYVKSNELGSVQQTLKVRNAR